MKKRTKIFLSCLSVFVVITAIVLTVGFTNRTVESNESGAKLAKVGFFNRSIVTSEKRAEFNLDKILSGDTGNGYTMNTCAFRGTVEKIEELDASWIDNNGENWGPYTNTIITIKPSEIYKGKFPEDTIKVLYSDTLLDISDDSVKIKKGGEYVFINCWIMDETYENYAKRNDPDIYKHNLILDKADVIMGGIWNSVFPVEDDKVIAYHEYFDKDENIRQKFLSKDVVSTNKLTSKESIQNGNYVILQETDFNTALAEMLNKADKKASEPTT